MSSLYNTPMKTFIEFIKVIAYALVIALIIRTFIVEPYYIPSASMLKTLQEGDRIFVTKFSYGLHLPFMQDEAISFGEPQHGDIIVFPYPVDPSVAFVKRVIGVAGDTIEIRNKQLYRNQEPVIESYIMHLDPFIKSGNRDNIGPFTVPEGKVFALGDNRDASKDSREWGFVDKTTIRGKATLIFWSSKNLFDVEWNRIGTKLQ